MEVRQRPPAVHLPRALDRQGHPMGGVRTQQRTAVGVDQGDRRGLPDCHLADRCPDGYQAGGGVLRPLRPQHDDPERPGQRPTDLPDRGGAHLPRGVRDLPHRPVDRGLPAGLTANPSGDKSWHCATTHTALSISWSSWATAAATTRSPAASPTSPEPRTRSSSPTTATGTIRRTTPARWPTPTARTT